MVTPLVGSVLGSVTSNVAAVVIKLVGKSYELWSDFDNDIESIKRELLMITGAEEDDLSIVMSVSKEEMHDLAFEIEDLLDRIQRYVVQRDGGPLHAVLGFASSLLLEAKVKKLKERLKASYQRKTEHNVNGCQPSLSWTTPANTYTTKIGPVGIDEYRREICDWVMKDVKGQPEQLSVISIVGFSGSGKSTLAKAVYDCPDVARRFPHRAWVVASEHGGGTEELLTALFKELGQGHQISDIGDVELLKAKISNYLKNTKRYLIVLDDIKNQTWWDGIKSAFPERATSRIIVTTTIQRVAKVCSRGNGYVHNMAPLDGKQSKELLEAVLKGYTPGLERTSASIVNICGGHPHALVTMANYLQSEGVITKTVCEQLRHSLGFRMATEDAFKELQKVLMNNYRSLPKEYLNLKTCLFYVCVFPNGCHIRRNRLTRRWFAEGYVQPDYPRSALVVANDHFKKLVDESIIWPIDTSKNLNVKTCRAHGIFREFLLHISKSAKFITSLENSDKKKYRHLFTQNTSSGSAHQQNSPARGDDKEKLRAHSLTICGNAGEAVGFFTKCELLRVLDLEECSDLKDEHMDGIHELWHLKYLSLGDTISRLPKEIEKVHCLETLDMRKTKKEIVLPAEVIKMPHLAHLLGKFKLGDMDWEKTEVGNFFEQESNLQTLAGLVTDDGNPGFPMLMPHMKKLSKVKIWCDSISKGSMSFTALLAAIEMFIQAGMDTCYGDRSMSLYLGNSSGDILSSLGDPRGNLIGYLSSLKLHGKLSGLTQFATLLYGLKELCLSSTNRLMNEDLQNLISMSSSTLLELECLKLVNVDLAGLNIRHGHFPQLLRLCLVQCPSLPTIGEGALPNLLSLGLLNQGLNGLSGVEIEKHKLLQELALDSEVNQETITSWEFAAKEHPKRPKVLFFKKIGPNVTGSMVKYVATERPVPGTGSSTMRGKREIERVESDSLDQLTSDMKRVKCEDPSLEQARIADPSLAPTELYTARDIEVASSSRVMS